MEEEKALPPSGPKRARLSGVQYPKRQAPPFCNHRGFLGKALLTPHGAVHILYCRLHILYPCKGTVHCKHASAELCRVLSRVAVTTTCLLTECIPYPWVQYRTSTILQLDRVTSVWNKKKKKIGNKTRQAASGAQVATAATERVCIGMAETSRAPSVTLGRLVGDQAAVHRLP